MMLYLDTSALIKLYINEAFREDVLLAVKKAKIVSTQVISYVEAHAAFSRLLREGKIDNTELTAIKNNFLKDWDCFLQVKSITSILQQAAKLTEVFSLRGYDSLQLAAAHYLFKFGDLPVTFACFDKKLNQAAEILGLDLLLPRD